MNKSSALALQSSALLPVADTNLQTFKTFVQKAQPLKRAMVSLKQALVSVAAGDVDRVFLSSMDAVLLAGRGYQASPKLAARIFFSAMDMIEQVTSAPPKERLLGFGHLDPNVWASIWKNNDTAKEMIRTGDIASAMEKMNESMETLRHLKSVTNRPGDLRRIEAMQTKVRSLPEEVVRDWERKQKEVTIFTFDPGGTVVEATGPAHLFPHGYESDNRSKRLLGFGADYDPIRALRQSMTDEIMDVVTRIQTAKDLVRQAKSMRPFRPGPHYATATAGVLVQAGTNASIALRKAQGLDNESLERIAQDVSDEIHDLYEVVKNDPDLIIGHEG